MKPRHITAIVLAAGASSRMAPDHKLLLRDANGTTMVGRVVQACCASTVDDVLVVIGHQAEAMRQAVRAAQPSRPVRFVVAHHHVVGLSASLAAGIAALPDPVTAALVCLGDMPLVGAELIDGVLNRYSPQAALIVVPTCHGQRGNPILWDRRYFPEMAALTGDTGARALLRTHATEVIEAELGSDAILRDFDTPESVRNGF